jgi:sodium-dependent phosphate cotransporter
MATASGPGAGAPSQPPPRPDARIPFPGWRHGLYAALFLYLFLSAINVMGAGLKTLGHSTDWLQRLLAHGDNPFIALCGAMLVTAIVQSSSFTTSLIITLVAAKELGGPEILKMETAIFAVMGANIGTSVTNTIVSLGNVRIRRQFRRAFTAAIVHDIFNVLTVAVLFPLEWVTAALNDSGRGVLTRAAGGITNLLGSGDVASPHSPIKLVTRPVVALVVGLGEWMTQNTVAVGLIVAVAGLALLFFALTMLVRNLKGALLRRIEGLFRRVFFRNDLTAYAVGAATTVLVQSSSVTTSFIVPLAGAGAVKLKRVFPYTLGANLGTTITGVIAATANPVSAAVTVAVSHVMFNLLGTAIWYPLRWVPLAIARRFGRLVARSKRYALLFFGLFIVIPVAGLLITELFAALFAGS